MNNSWLNNIGSWVKSHIVLLMIIWIAIVLFFVGNYTYRDLGKFIDKFSKEKEIAIIQQKDEHIKELNSKIELLKNDLEKSQKIYIELNKKITNLEKKKQEIKKPKDTEEIKNRLRALGYDVK